MPFVSGRYEQTAAEKDLEKKLWSVIKAHTPPGTRVNFDIEAHYGAHLNIRFLCDGTTNGYLCGLDVGHYGECYTYNKNHEFIPDNKPIRSPPCKSCPTG